VRIRLLGTGTPTPSLKRMSSGYLVETASRKILFDFGPGAYHRLLEAGVKPTEITDVFFTHLHYDHCLDYIRLVMTRWDQGAGRIPELNVYGPAHTARMTDLIVGDDGIFGPDLAARTELPMSQAVFVARGGTLPRAKPRPVVRELRSGEVVDGGDFRVEVRAVIHAQPILDCFGYRVEADGRSFAYSGDAGPCEAMAQLARDCDVLVHMCHFISGTALNREFDKRNMGHLELARLGERANVRNVVVSHVTEQFDRPGLRERVIHEMSQIYKGNIFFGEDLMEIPVEGPRPVKLD
jgi:ribonuclease BN (tRNA processing enzyme)